jgi:hypothetical protein
MPLTDDDVAQLFSRLDTVVKLLAAMYVRDMQNNDAIVKLDNMQLSREQIADAVNVTTHNVSQTLYAAKKATEGKKGAGRKKENGSERVAPSAVPIEEAVAVGESEVQQ